MNHPTPHHKLASSVKDHLSASRSHSHSVRAGGSLGTLAVHRTRCLTPGWGDPHPPTRRQRSRRQSQQTPQGARGGVPSGSTTPRRPRSCWAPHKFIPQRGTHNTFADNTEPTCLGKVSSAVWRRSCGGHCWVRPGPRHGGGRRLAGSPILKGGPGRSEGTQLWNVPHYASLSSEAGSPPGSSLRNRLEFQGRLVVMGSAGLLSDTPLCPGPGGLAPLLCPDGEGRL